LHDNEQKLSISCLLFVEIAFLGGPTNTFDSFNRTSFRQSSFYRNSFNQTQYQTLITHHHLYELDRLILIFFHQIRISNNSSILIDR